MTAPTEAPTDRVLACAHGCGETPHRWRDSAEAGDSWRCSECGEVTPTFELTAKTTRSGRCIFRCTGCGDESYAPAKGHECAPTETPGLTTEQARDLASRWVESRENGVRAHGWLQFPGEREQLFAWVRAQMADCAKVPEPGSGGRVSLAAYVEAQLDPGVLEGKDPFGFEPAWDLCEAAGWPS